MRAPFHSSSAQEDVWGDCKHPAHWHSPHRDPSLRLTLSAPALTHTPPSRLLEHTTPSRLNPVQRYAEVAHAMPLEHHAFNHFDTYHNHVVSVYLTGNCIDTNRKRRGPVYLEAHVNLFKNKQTVIIITTTATSGCLRLGCLPLLGHDIPLSVIQYTDGYRRLREGTTPQTRAREVGRVRMVTREDFWGRGTQHFFVTFGGCYYWFLYMFFYITSYSNPSFWFLR